MRSVTVDGDQVYPSKIVCVGRNYAAHIRELGNEAPQQTVFFIKPNSSLSDEVISDADDLIHYEGEISFLIGSGKIEGVGFGLDLTKRALQQALKSKGLPWERAKAFDHSAVFSQFVPFDGDSSQLSMALYRNGELTQSGGYELMLSKPAQLLSEASTFLTFEDGDILMTGTPAGVGPVRPGDQLRGEILQNGQRLVERSWTVLPQHP